MLSTVVLVLGSWTDHHVFECFATFVGKSVAQSINEETEIPSLGLGSHQWLALL